MLASCGSHQGQDVDSGDRNCNEADVLLLRHEEVTHEEGEAESLEAEPSADKV